MPVEPHPYTLQEALEMLEKGNPLIFDAIEEGKMLYKSEDYEKGKKECEEVIHL